jgi:threonylcarbamoyladenosine tRNA methylthiotransferase MtaB
MVQNTPREVMRQRSQDLHDLGMRMKRDVLQQNLGQTYEVLIEGQEQHPDDGSIIWGGYTPNFLRIAVPYSPGNPLDNQIIKVQLDSLCSDGATISGRTV